MPAFQDNELWRLLGHPDGPAAAGKTRVKGTRAETDFTTEELEIETPQSAVPATLLRPHAKGIRHPAVLYCHAHGNRPEIGRSELVKGRPALLAPYGPLLASRGFVVLCADMPGFGERQSEGGEEALAKAALWKGKTLMGQMLCDLSAALDHLSTREDVDPDRIATLGLSMGATHAYWLATLDSRISATAHLCVFANMKPLIETGAHDLHGPYMTVPGLLANGDMADIAASIAPRPQLIAYGKNDPLTPASAVEPAIATLRRAYARTPENLSIVVSEKTGHAETSEMREAVMQFLGRL